MVSQHQLAIPTCMTCTYWSRKTPFMIQAIYKGIAIEMEMHQQAHSRMIGHSVATIWQNLDSASKPELKVADGCAVLHSESTLLIE